MRGRTYLRTLCGKLQRRLRGVKKRLLRQQFLAVLLSLLLSALLYLQGLSETDILPGMRLPREEPGRSEKSYQLEVSGLSEKTLPMEVRVSPRRYRAEEAEAVFTELYQSMEHRITGETESLDAVTEDLHLPSSFPELGIRASWEFCPEPEGKTQQERDVYERKYGSLIEEDGTVHNEDFSEGESVSGHLRFVLSADVVPDSAHPEYLDRRYHSLPYSLFVTVLPRRYTVTESLQKALEKELRRIDSSTLAEAQYPLPEQLLGHRIRFSMPKNRSYLYLPLLGILFAAGLYFREQENRKQEKRKRERQLLLDYAELVSKLNVYLGAGLTIRNAFSEISSHYDVLRESTGGEDRWLYRELREIPRKLRENIPESEVYRAFGESIGLRPYTKLVSLIEQSRKNGSGELRSLLSLEMADAFELRKTEARRRGEEAGTKLLLPLLLQLLIVMLVIVVPAVTVFR
ncbi:MAG: hypothetical protein ACTTHL_05525 [Oribacterium sp.]